MSLFKRKRDTETTCACGENCNTEITSVKVLGSGCKSCHQLYENTKEAVKQMGLNVEVEYVTDMEAEWKEVLAVYAVAYNMTNTHPANPDEVQVITLQLPC